jgi:hypothetical protein
MESQIENKNRRDFFKKMGLSVMPLLMPPMGINSRSFLEKE